MSNYHDKDRQSSGWTQEAESRDDYGRRVIGRRRCTIKYTHYVANLAVLPVHGTLSSMCHTNCTR